MKKQILVMTFVLLAMNLVCILCSCTKKNSEKINFEEYSIKLSSEKLSNIKKKLEYLGYEKFKLYINKNSDELMINNFSDYDEKSEGSPLKPEITFISEKNKDYILFNFDYDPMFYNYYKDNIGNEYFYVSAEDDTFCYIVSGEYLDKDNVINYHKVDKDDEDIKLIRNWIKEELKFIGITQKELWATMSYYLNEKIDEKNKSSIENK